MQKQTLLNLISAFESSRGDTQHIMQFLFNFFQTAQNDINLLYNSLYLTTEFIMNSKEIDSYQKLLNYEAILCRIIDITLKYRFTIGVESLKFMFDTSKEYYKHNMLDRNIDYPIGKGHPLQTYQPKINEQCDVIKPYITTTSPFGWVRCILLNISQNGIYTIKYHNQSDVTLLKDKPFFAPLGTRCKDFQWRMNLKIGDMLDAQDGKNVWYYSTIIEEANQNGTKKVRVTFRQFTPNGDKIDSEGKKYFGLGPNQDEWIDVISPRIQQAHKMHKKLCYYSSSNHNQFVLEDSFDITFQQQFNKKPFYGMLRFSFCKSQTIITLYNHLVNNQAFNIINEMMFNNQNIDHVLNSGVVIGMTNFLTPRMAVKQLYQNFVFNLLEFIKRHMKLITPIRYDMIIYILENTLKRLVSLSEKHEIIEKLKRQLILQLLPLNLEKQLLSVRLINQTIRPVKPMSKQQKEDHLKFIRQTNLFEKLFQQSNIHQHILTRSIQFLKYLLSNNQITFWHLEYLWKVIPMNDLRGRAALQKLIGELVPDMSHDQVYYILQKIFQIKQADLTIDNLSLLKALKNKLYSRQYIIKTLEFLWDLITIKAANLKAVIEAEVELVFKGFIGTVYDNEIRFQLLKDMLKRLKEVKFIKNQASLLKEFITNYKSSRAADQLNQVPVCIPQVIVFLKQQGIYSILFILLTNQKTEQKVKQILLFMTYLFQNDFDTDIGEIIKQVYLKLGPSELVLKWFKQSANKIISFSFWFFNNFDTIPLFINLSLQGFTSLKTLFFQVNSYYGNIRLSRGKRAVAVDAIGPLNKEDTVQIQWVQKQFFVTKYPEKLIGIGFWQKLLEVVKDSQVFSKIVQFIVKLITSLDETLFDATIQIRKYYLEKIIKSFLAINNEVKEFTEAHKEFMARNFSILNQFMAQTQVDGLYDLQPHFELIDGDNINLKIENNYLNNKAEKQINITINQNITLWKLKKYIAFRINQNPLNLVICRLTKTIQNKSNGKSLAQNGFFKNETIRVEKVKQKEIPRYNLLDQSNTTLSERMNALVEIWFNKYQGLDNLLSQQKLSKFYQDYTHGAVKIKDINSIIKKFDSNGDFKLTLQQFKLHIIQRCKQQPQGIWKFLQLNGYRNDLKHKDEASKKLSVAALPRAILSNQFTYDLIFTMLRNPVLKPIHYSLFKLIISLPTVYTIKLHLSQNISIQNWKQINCNYQFGYIITVLLQQLTKLDEIFYQFLVIGGIQCLLQRLMRFEIDKKNIYQFELQEKNVIITILKILNIYFFILHLDDPKIFVLYNQRVNLLQIEDFITALNKVTILPDLFTQTNTKCKELNLKIDYYAINQVSELILRNLIKNYKNQYLREIVTESAKLSAMLTKILYPNTITLYDALFIDSMSLRKVSMNILYYLSQVKPQNSESLITELLQIVPKEIKEISHQYFLILTKLMDKLLNSKESKLNILQLTEDFIKKILNGKPQEKKNQYYSDKTLQGQLELVYTILSKRQDICKKLQHYKHQFMKHGLFAYKIYQKIQNKKITPEMMVPQKNQMMIENYVMFKSLNNRKLVIDIIILFLKINQQEDQFLEEYILPLVKQFPERFRKPNTKTLSVGLYNLGSICYMNAMLQMLGNIQPFRNGILLAKNSESRLLGELQRLYSFLYFSERQDFVPDQILKVFNPPINPMIQQDTTEFLNFLFDHIQIQLKPTPFKNLLREIFQGNTVVQMICHSCGKKRERKQQFYCYTVGVKDKNNLEEAFEAMHVGQVINDCLCQQCGQRGDLTKRSVLGDIPNILFIHLQRIVFNLDIFMNTKIHSRLEFPTQINLQPYTKQGVQLRQSLGIEYLKNLAENQQENKKFKSLTLHNKQQKHYNLKLKGIIIHSGSADVGHYYSIVNRTDGSWLKFDDSRVSLFGQSSIDSECYGGSFTAGEEWALMGQQSKNAYVLVYEKELKTPIKLQLKQTADQELINYLDIKRDCNQIQYSKFKTYNLQSYYKEVWLDNHMLMVQLHMLHEGFGIQFIKFVENVILYSKTNKKAEIILDVFFRVSSQSGQIGNLIDIFQTCQMNAFDLFQKHMSDLKKVGDFLFHNQRIVRGASAKCFKTIIIRCLTNHYEESNELIYKMLNFFLGLLNTEIARNWLKCESFFAFIDMLVLQSSKIPFLYNFFLEKHLIALYVDFIMEKDSPLKLSHKKHQMGNKFTPVQFGAAIQTIFFFVQRSFYLIGQNHQRQPIPQEQLFHFNQEQAIALSCMQFYTKMIKQKQNVKILKYILNRLSIKNFRYSQAICRVVLTLLNQTMQKLDELKLVLECIEQVLNVTDQLWIYRAQMILGYGQAYTSRSNTFSHIEEERYVYNSTIQNIFPVQCILYYMYTNRIRNPLCTFYIINSVLKIILQTNISMNYFFKLPSINYLYSRYYQWIKPYLSHVKAMLNTQKIDIKQFDSMMDQNLNILNHFQKYINDSQHKIEGIITGTTVLRQTIARKPVMPERKIYQQTNQLQVYCLRSNPSPNDPAINGAFQNYLTNGRLQIKKIHPQSTILYFMQTSQPPIILKNEAVKDQKQKQGFKPLVCGDINENIQKGLNNGQKIIHYDSDKPEESSLLVQLQNDELINKHTQKLEQQKINENKFIIQQEQKKLGEQQIKFYNEQESEYIKIDLSGIFTCNYFRQIIIENKEDNNVWIKIQFINNQVTQTNCLLPKFVSNLVRANSKQTFILLNKYDYLKDWGIFNYRITIQNGNKYSSNQPKIIACYKLYNNTTESLEQKIQNQQENNNKIGQDECIQNNHNDNFNFSDEKIDQESKSCSVCTLHNPISAIQCEACGTPFL